MRSRLLRRARYPSWPTPSGLGLSQAVAKRPGSPIALPNNVLRTCCVSHELFLEHFWLGLSCFNTSG
eukprot:8226810-Pyramimonas_sp.AAC.1